MELQPDIKGFFLNPDGSFRQLSDLASISIQDLCGQVTETCFEDNYHAPGGWGQYAQGLKIMQNSIHEMSRILHSWKAYKRLFKQYIFEVDQIINLGEFLLDEAKILKRKGIIIVVANERYLHPKTEPYYLFNFFQRRRVDVSFIYILDLLDRIDNDALTVENYLFYCYYNDAEIRIICNQKGLDFNEIWNKIKTSGTQNIFGREDLNLSDRGWINETGINNQSSIFKPIIYDKDLSLIGDELHFNNMLIDLSKMVLKTEGSYGGKGIYLPHQLSTHLIQKLIQSGERFVLEYFVQQPLTYQPIVIFSREYDSWDISYSPSFLAKLLVDTRITFLVDSNHQFKVLNFFIRANYPGRPTNLDNGGISLCTWVVTDREFNHVFRKLNCFWAELTTLEFTEFANLVASGLSSEGVINPKNFKPYGLGLIPYVISESSAYRLIEAAQIWVNQMQYLYTLDGYYHKPFIATLDCSLRPFSSFGVVDAP